MRIAVHIVIWSRLAASRGKGMPLELGIWRIDQRLASVAHQPMDNEKRLEELLDKDISIIAPHLMVIGRQVPTSFGKFVDLLAIDIAGNLAVIELKRDQTPRDVVAQALDYGSWVHTLGTDEIAGIWQRYLEKFRPTEKGTPLDQAFCKRFQVKSMPDELNSEHELIVVASSLDDSTERIVDYLAGYHDVNINAVLFRLFKDGEREYLTRAWLRDPSAAAIESTGESPNTTWNGEYYASFGGGRDWDEAVKYGFFAAGGGSWYSNTLDLLSPGDRVWVNIPGTGYVGVGIVEKPKQIIDEFMVTGPNGTAVPITSLPLRLVKEALTADGPDKAEYLVRVKWLKTVPADRAIKERGFFGNQNSVARPKSQKWNFTVERLKERFGVN